MQKEKVCAIKYPLYNIICLRVTPQEGFLLILTLVNWTAQNMKVVNIYTYKDQYSCKIKCTVHAVEQVGSNLSQLQQNSCINEWVPFFYAQEKSVWRSCVLMKQKLKFCFNCNDYCVNRTLCCPIFSVFALPWYGHPILHV